MVPILLVLLSVNCFITSATLTCGENEEVDDCPACCSSDYCPTSDGQDETCLKPDKCPSPDCKCRFNYRRAANGTCIPTTECPAFDCPNPNEVYDSCPPLCPTDSCTQASPTGECPPLGAIGIILACKPDCRCKKGYWRLENGVCVAYEECPGVSK